jgi:hypothetical protein
VPDIAAVAGLTLSEGENSSLWLRTLCTSLQGDSTSLLLGALSPCWLLTGDGSTVAAAAASGVAETGTVRMIDRAGDRGSVSDGREDGACCISS